MIVRRYGSKVSSVQPNFDSRAMTEVGFRRDGALTVEADEFAAGYERVWERALTAAEEGAVQGDVEDAVLAALEQQLAALEAGVEDGQMLVVENQPGTDQPKTRGTQETRVVAGENRLHFRYTIDPPLRVGLYRRKG